MTIIDRIPTSSMYKSDSTAMVVPDFLLYIVLNSTLEVIAT